MKIMETETKELKVSRRRFFAAIIQFMSFLLCATLAFVIEYKIKGATDPQTATVLDYLIGFMFIAAFVFGASFATSQGGWFTDED